MKSRFGSLGVLAGLLVAACGETPRPTEPVTAEPLFNVSGSTTQCVGGLSGTHENVEVPPSASCTIIGAVIRGSVKALQHSELLMENTEVGGNVEGDKAGSVRVIRGSVNGSIIIKEGVTASSFCGADLRGVVVGEGNIQIEQMTTRCVFIEGVLMGKGNIKVQENNIFAPTIISSIIDNVGAVNIQVFKNRGPAPKHVQFNQARLIQCFENDQPFAGGPNPATPQKEGQCF
jgi:hypothetical protein